MAIMKFLGFNLQPADQFVIVLGGDLERLSSLVHNICMATIGDEWKSALVVLLGLANCIALCGPGLPTILLSNYMINVRHTHYSLTARRQHRNGSWIG
jgi:hypothetical protein